MANNTDNLIPFNELTEEEQRALASKGGKASVEARRRKRDMKKTLEMLATLPFNLTDKNGNGIKKQLAALGINEEDIDYEMAMNYSIFLTAIKGGKNQVSAATFIRDTLGEKPKEVVEVSKTTDETIKEVENYLSSKKEVGNNE